MWKRLVRRWVFVVLVGAVVAFAFVKGETGIVMIVGGFVVLPLGLALLAITISAYRTPTVRTSNTWSGQPISDRAC